MKKKVKKLKPVKEFTKEQMKKIKGGVDGPYTTRKPGDLITAEDWNEMT